MSRVQLASIGMASTLFLVAAAAIGADSVAVPPVASAPSTSTSCEQDAASLAAKLLDSPSIRPGLCVHVNCGDGKLTAALYMQGKYHVQGLDENPANVTAAREFIASRSLYGRVVVDRFYPPKLPFADDLINLLVIDGFAELQDRGLTLAEAMRVVAPYGTLVVGGMPEDRLRKAFQEAGFTSVDVVGDSVRYARIVKPYPRNMDEWPQMRHDAAKTAISQDRIVGPVTGVRWIQGPEWSDAWTPAKDIVSANGRVFYLMNPTPVDPAPAVEARDAFNGTLLWERPISFGTDSKPKLTFNANEVIASGDLLFARLEEGGSVVALDAATGKLVRDYGVAGEMAFYEGDLIVRDAPNTWSVFEVGSGKRLRQFAVREAAISCPILIGEGKVLLVEINEGNAEPQSSLVCFDYKSGNLLWKAPNQGDGSLFSLQRGILFTQANAALHAYLAKDGSHLWQHDSGRKRGNFLDAFYLDDRLWVYSTGAYGDPQNRLHHQAIEPMTGKILFDYEGRERTQWRCSPELATERGFIMGMDFSFYDLKSNTGYDYPALRSDCGVGAIPANGLCYQCGNQCKCGPFLTGIFGLSSEVLPAPAELKRLAGERFEKGPAYGQLAPKEEATSGNWPTFRHDAFRSGATDVSIAGNLKVAWQKKISAGISSPVIANGMVFVASLDENKVMAMDAQSGEIRWQYTAGARVDSPPTIYDGLAMFGSRDGWVYCLQASTGELVWRFRAAPADRRIAVRGQFESLWPVFGSVLVQDGLVYFAAGRHADSDGGIFFYTLKSATGEVVWEDHLQGFPPFRSNPAYRLHETYDLSKNAFDETQMSVAGDDMREGINRQTANDILISDGKSIFLGAVGLDIADRTWNVPFGVSLYAGGKTFLSDDTMETSTSRNMWRFMGEPHARAWRDVEPGRGTKYLISANCLVVGGQSVFGILHKHDAKQNRCESQLTAFRNPTDATPAQVAAPLWQKVTSDQRAKAVLAAGDRVFVAYQRCDSNGGSGQQGGQIIAYAAADGAVLGTWPLSGNPLFDGMAATPGRLYVAGEDGSISCLEEKDTAQAAMAGAK